MDGARAGPGGAWRHVDGSGKVLSTDVHTYPLSKLLKSKSKLLKIDIDKN